MITEKAQLNNSEGTPFFRQLSRVALAYRCL
jgi:hypothetical protein